MSVGKLVILGAGESGCGAALLGKSKGYKVFVSDSGQLSSATRLLFKREHIEFEEEDIVRSGLVKEYIITKHKLGYDQALCA